MVDVEGPSTAKQDASNMLIGYQQAIFPMADDRDAKQFHWFTCEQRGIIPLHQFHVPKSLKKKIKKGCYRLSVNQHVQEMLRHCAQREDGSWISYRLEKAYEELNQQGHLISVEVSYDGLFSGGLFGVFIRGAFFGESMVSLQPDSSKIALTHLVAALQLAGFHLLDTQTTTSHLERFGQRTISSDDYQKILEQALDRQPISLKKQLIATTEQNFMATWLAKVN